MDASPPPRPKVRGKFLWLGDRKLYVRGVTYGTFRPRDDGCDYPTPDRVDEDFAAMAAAGFNTVRTYTVPPLWLLDTAQRRGLLVMIGMPWEQHVAFLDDAGRCDSIEERVREGVRTCAGHPAVLAYTIGNEIPASIVRWHGRRRVERFLERLFCAAKGEDPEGLVTYVNFPTTEYLELPFLDFSAFNVYLESEETLSAYLARLQVVADERPLVMAEIGLDSRSNGEQGQAESLRWQLSTAFGAGCAGAIVFAWTDEWHRGGFDIEDWDFGLVERDRSPKPALEAVRTALGELPLPPPDRWPRCSVVVCSYNGARTICDCLAAAATLNYPDYEVIVVDDGSEDGTAEIAESYGAEVISTPNRGLSSARNTGARAATGEIVAYCDDDAIPDPDWLTFLAATYMTTDHVAVGGPNIAPRGVGTVAECIRNAPGNPIHVLLSDTEAEHIPGCNASFRRDALMEVGGFDPQFRIAGDDVDLCWRLQNRGWTIGFNAAAMVWHRPRDSVRGFWRQQRNYGRAEAMLERKWPERYNSAGHVSWAGRVYATGRRTFLERWRVYYGTWGSGFFQRLYSSGQPDLAHLPLMPEWFLVILLLALLTGLGALWTPLLVAAPVLVAAIAAVTVEAWRGARRARFTDPPPHRPVPRRFRALTAFLFVMQSYARLHGRLREGLRPWNRRPRAVLRVPRPRVRLVWSETWRVAEDRLREVEARLRDAGLRVRRGGDFDRWDLDIRGGALARARLRMAIEEHGGGRQQMLFRVAPLLNQPAIAALALLTAVTAAAFVDGAPAAGGVLALITSLIVAVAGVEASSAVSAAEAAVDPPAPAEPHRRPETRPTILEGIAREVALGEVVAVVPSNGHRHELRALLESQNGAADEPCDIGLLRSEPLLVPLTIAENIALRRPDAPFEDIRAAAVAAVADTFIERLPRGYNTLIGSHGSPLTYEQRHRIAIARAFLEDAPVLVMGQPIERMGNGCGERLRPTIELLTEGRRTVVLADSSRDAGAASRTFAVEGDRLVEVL